MRIFKTSGFGWIGPFIFLSAIWGGHLLAQEDEPSPSAQQRGPSERELHTTPDKGTPERKSPPWE